MRTTKNGGASLAMGKVKEEIAVSGEDYLFELIGYLLTSTEMVVEGRGPPIYSALRFLEVAYRLIDLPKYLDSLDEDAYLVELKRGIDKIKPARARDKGVDILRDGIKELLLDIASEALRRVES